MFIVAVLLSLTIVESAYDEEYRYIDTLNGKVKGQRTHLEAFDDTYGFSYQGIPFAKPPLGELRFKKPQPAEPWEGTLVADTMPAACIQYSSYPYPWYDQEPGKSEDCLYLNIWTPYDDKSNARPVILFIHGGGFQVGSNRMDNYNGLSFSTDWEGSEKEETFFHASKGAVVVTINYRLGAFGFLTTGTDDAPGNVGIYDMVLALNWVKKNIDVFNGNPELITLYGQGAGAIAVSLLCVSPVTKGLFQRAILNSGTFVSFKKDRYRENLRLSQRLAKAVGCTSENMTFLDNPKEVITCLQGINATELAVTLNSFDPDAHFILYPEYDGEILSHDPVQNLKDGKVHNVSILLAASFSEGSFLLTTMYPEVFGRFGEHDQGINLTFGKSILKDVFKSYPDPDKMAQYYLRGAKETDQVEIRRRIYQALGDDRIFCPIVYFGEKYGDHTRRVHFFEFDFQKPLMTWGKWMGSVHYNDAPYLLSRSLLTVVKDYDSDEKFDPAKVTASFSIRQNSIYFARVGEVVNKEWHQNQFWTHDRKYTVISDSHSKFDIYRLPDSTCDFLRKYHGFER